MNGSDPETSLGQAQQQLNRSEKPAGRQGWEQKEINKTQQ